MVLVLARISRFSRLYGILIDIHTDCFLQRRRRLSSSYQSLGYTIRLNACAWDKKSSQFSTNMSLYRGNRARYRHSYY